MSAVLAGALHPGRTEFVADVAIGTDAEISYEPSDPEQPQTYPSVIIASGPVTLAILPHPLAMGYELAVCDVDRWQELARCVQAAADNIAQIWSLRSGKPEPIDVVVDSALTIDEFHLLERTVETAVDSLAGKLTAQRTDDPDRDLPPDDADTARDIAATILCTFIRRYTAPRHLPTKSGGATPNTDEEVKPPMTTADDIAATTPDTTGDAEVAQNDGQAGAEEDDDDEDFEADTSDR